MKFLNYELGEWKQYARNHYRCAPYDDNIFFYIGVLCRDLSAVVKEYRFHYWIGDCKGGILTTKFKDSPFYDLSSIYYQLYTTEYYVSEEHLQELKDNIDKFIIKTNKMKAFL